MILIFNENPRDAEKEEKEKSKNHAASGESLALSSQISYAGASRMRKIEFHFRILWFLSP